MAVQGPSTRENISALNVHVSQPESCRLCSLPAEIRNQIYQYSIVHVKPLGLYPKADPIDIILQENDSSPGRTSVRPSEPALTKTCRQIRIEALPVFYGENVFQDSFHIPDCRAFLLGLTPAKQRMLKEVHVAPPNGRRILFADLLDGVSSVETQAKLEEMRSWMHEKNVELDAGALRVTSLRNT